MRHQNLDVRSYLMANLLIISAPVDKLLTVSTCQAIVSDAFAGFSSSDNLILRERPWEYNVWILVTGSYPRCKDNTLDEQQEGGGVGGERED